MNELLQYLYNKKRQNKMENLQKAYEELRLTFPNSKIPFKNVNSFRHELLGNHKLIDQVPRYWKYKTPKNMFSEKFTVPKFILDSGLLDARNEQYFRANTNGKRRIFKAKMGELTVNIQQLYEKCEDYKTIMVKNVQYDGTDRFFMNKTKKGILSESLEEALGEASALFLPKEIPKKPFFINSNKTNVYFAPPTIPTVNYSSTKLIDSIAADKLTENSLNENPIPGLENINDILHDSTENSQTQENKHSEQSKHYRSKLRDKIKRLKF